MNKILSSRQKLAFSYRESLFFVVKELRHFSFIFFMNHREKELMSFWVDI